MGRGRRIGHLGNGALEGGSAWHVGAGHLGKGACGLRGGGGGSAWQGKGRVTSVRGSCGYGG